MWMWSTGINRNIVECKVFVESETFSLDEVLIETLWNVKCIHPHTSYKISRINRNIVECKEL